MNPPNTIASDTLVEAIARAIGEVARRDLLVGNGWSMPKNAAQAALTAITEARFAVVPVEPTEAMERNGGQEYAMTFQRPTIAETNAKAIYRAMIAAAPSIDTKEGE